VLQTNKTLVKILTKLVNAKQIDWDVILVTALWAYRMAQYTPFESVYDIQPIMLT